MFQALTIVVVLKVVLKFVLMPALKVHICIIKDFLFPFFRYDLYRTADGKWGAPDERGVWSGMIGMVKRNVIKTFNFGI